MKTILLTGPVRSFGVWSHALEGLGWKVETLALIETINLDDFEIPVASEVDWLVFTSRSALEAVGFHDDLANTAVAVVGQATERHARELGYNVRVVGTSGAEELARELAPKVARRRVHWFHGNLAEGLGERLSEKGAKVTTSEVYRTRSVAIERTPEADVVFFASPSAVRAFDELFGEPKHAVAIGPTTLEAIDACSWSSKGRLREPSPDGLRGYLEPS